MTGLTETTPEDSKALVSVKNVTDNINNFTLRIC